MFDLFIFIAALATAASPSPSSAPIFRSAPPLKEIVHIRATAACAELAVHANGAITSALHNDSVVASTIATLQHADLQKNVIQRRNELQALGDLAKDMKLAAVSGIGEVAKLREIAEKSRDPVQRIELKAFADLLGGALYRQKQVGNDLNGFLAKMDYKDMSELDDSQKSMNMAVFGSEDPRAIFPREVAPGNTPRRVSSQDAGQLLPNTSLEQKLSDDQLAANAAADFQARVSGISNDEALANQHTLGAVSGC
ncbi:MAG: hypothetical protein ABI182_07095 [Candidatus Baltobacteraceae bacterium]